MTPLSGPDQKLPLLCGLYNLGLRSWACFNPPNLVFTWFIQMSPACFGSGGFTLWWTWSFRAFTKRITSLIQTSFCIFPVACKQTSLDICLFPALWFELCSFHFVVCSYESQLLFQTVSHRILRSSPLCDICKLMVTFFFWLLAGKGELCLTGCLWLEGSSSFSGPFTWVTVGPTSAWSRTVSEGEKLSICSI